MLDLFHKGLPNSIEVHGKPYVIKTDFQNILCFTRMLKDKHDLKEYDQFYAGLIPHDRAEGYQELLKFVFPVRELPRTDGETSEEIILDYEKDSELIYSAFFQTYGIDLFQEQLHLHWYKFQALLQGLKDTKLNEVMAIRSYTPAASDSEAYRKQMLKQKHMWHIEQELSDEEKKIVAEFDNKLKGEKHGKTS